MEKKGVETSNIVILPLLNFHLFSIAISAT